MHRGLEERIRVLIGLTCSHNVSRLGTELLLKSSSIERLGDISYRGNGWPSGVRIRTCDREYFYHNNNSLWFDIFASFCFCPPYCFYCDDDLAECSDINVSDAWLQEELSKKDNIGTSIVVAWNDTGQRILTNYQYLFSTEQVTSDDLYRSQALPLYLKKHIFSGRRTINHRLLFALVRIINYVSFSKIYRLLPLSIQLNYVKFSRKLVHKALTLSQKLTKG